MEKEFEQFEENLRRIAPAKVPADLAGRLRAARVVAPRQKELQSPRVSRWVHWLAGWRGLAVATPAVALGVFLWLAARPGTEPVTRPGKIEPADSIGIKASNVQVGHSLVASFDAVAQWPDGEPVRFRCRQWQDDVVIHDNKDGVVISQSTPRVEVVPVRFESY